MAGVSNPKIQWTILMLFAVLATLCTAAAGKTIYVGDDGRTDFASIQAGIDATADGDTVLVTPGEYVVTEPITFRGKAITVKSEAGPDETTIRMGTPADTNRGSVVVFEDNETAASVLEGFTITGGTGSILNASPWGGGILFNASSGTVRNCAVVQNRAKHGGGIFCAYPCSPILIDCTIDENVAELGFGGGVYAYSGASPSLSSCIIRDNSATGTAYGTGLGAGACCYRDSSLTMSDCTIVGNMAYAGGGLFCMENSSATMTYCILIGNMARLSGGGIEIWNYSFATVGNCVVARNTAVEGGGGMKCALESPVTVTNSIFWENSAPGGPIGPRGSIGHEIWVRNGGTLDITYSNVAGGQAKAFIEAGTLNWGEGNIDADPLFAEPGYWADINDPNNILEPDDPNATWIDGDYHLKSEAGRWNPYGKNWVQDDVTSPCIDRGDPNSPVGDELDPNGGIINMGAYGGTPEASMSIGQLPPLPPLAHWKLDETEGDIAYDSAGVNDALVIGDRLWQPTGGQVDGALQLDGIDDYVSTGSVLNPADDEFSVIAWIKGGAAGQTIVSQEGGVSWLMANPTDGALRTDLRTPATTGRNAKPPGPPLICSTVATDGDWHRIGFVWDGSYRHLYVDGDEVATDATPLSELESAEGGLYFGVGSTLTPGTFFSGLIDDVHIYNRVVKP